MADYRRIHVSSGFGLEMTKLLLEKGDTVIGTVRSTNKVAELMKQYPETFGCKILDVTDVPAVRKQVHRQMRVAGIVSVRRRAYKATTNSQHSQPPAPRLTHSPTSRPFTIPSGRILHWAGCLLRSLMPASWHLWQHERASHRNSKIHSVFSCIFVSVFPGRAQSSSTPNFVVNCRKLYWSAHLLFWRYLRSTLRADRA